VPEPSNLTKTDLKEILVTRNLASKITKHHVVTLTQYNTFAEGNLQIISALHNFNQSFGRYFCQTNFTGIISQAREILAKFDYTEIISMQNIGCKQINKLNSKTVAVENDIFFEFTFLTCRNSYPEPAVLRTLVTIQDEEAIPLVDLSR
jgi:hypothetical protein